MGKTDARKLTPEAQQPLRQQAIRLRKRGFTHQQIAEIIGAHHTRICRWCRAYETGDATALSIRKRGCRSGSGRRLSAEPEQRLRQMIQDKTPDQLKLAFAL